MPTKRGMRRVPPTLLLSLAALALPSSAGAADGGGATYENNGGAGYGDVPPSNPAEPREETAEMNGLALGEGPVLTDFALSSRSLYLYGRPARVRFQIDSRADTVDVSLSVARVGSSRAPRTIELGERPAGVPQAYWLSGREGGKLPEGDYSVRILATDGAGNALRTAARVSSTAQLSLYAHRFPIAGAFTYSGPDGRFGAPRTGHPHQGQDLIAPEGTPVVAPRGGRVKTVAYQGEGAGHYVIVDGAGESLDYAFFHLQAGSIRVREGQYVRTGARVASVGNTGRSFGAHLHFEIWRGAWFAGGEAIDPLPFLRRWGHWS